MGDWQFRWVDGAGLGRRGVDISNWVADLVNEIMEIELLDWLLVSGVLALACVALGRKVIGWGRAKSMTGPTGGCGCANGSCGVKKPVLEAKLCQAVSKNEF